MFLSPCGVKSIVCVARMSFRCRLLVSPVPTDYVGLSSPSVHVTGLAADLEDTSSSTGQLGKIRNCNWCQGQNTGERTSTVHWQTSAILVWPFLSDELPLLHPSEENGSDMDDPDFQSDSEGETDGRNETYPEAEVRCTLHNHCQYCFTWRNSTDSVKYTRCLAHCLMAINQAGDCMQGGVFHSFFLLLAI